MRTKRVTIKDIATEAGVSIALVSFVMNNKSDGKETYRVNKETAQRILEVAQKLNYQPNNAARTLRSGKTNTIGVIVSDISNKFFADIARCIENHAYKHKYTVLFGSTDENPQKLENLVEVFRNKGIDVFIESLKQFAAATSPARTSRSCCSTARCPIWKSAASC